MPAAIGVIRHAFGWKLIAPDRSSRVFAFKVDAEEAALRLAGEARARGEILPVLVQGDFGELRRIKAA